MRYSPTLSSQPGVRPHTVAATVETSSSVKVMPTVGRASLPLSNSSLRAGVPAYQSNHAAMNGRPRTVGAMAEQSQRPINLEGLKLDAYPSLAGSYQPQVNATGIRGLSQAFHL